MTIDTAATDPFERQIARSATGLLAELNRPEGVSAADVHVATRICALGDCADEKVLVAAALTVRAVRHGSVCLDLDSEHIVELVADRAWSVPRWREALLASSVVREADGGGVTPLVLDGTRLYLDRYWTQEGRVVDDLRRRRSSAPQVPDTVDRALDRYFPPAPDGVTDDFSDQRAAAQAAVHGWTTVVTGGPGTGKTTTIARLLGVLVEVEECQRIALAAPTGRAAARLGEAVSQATAHPTFPDGPARDRIAALTASTLHRLLGWQPGRGTFRHDRDNRLPYDVVVIDETSMVSLTMMARLVEAVRPQARLILVGDADQLASVDAGAVLGDLVRGLGQHAPEVRTLTRSRRFGARIGDLAEAIRTNQPDTVMSLLSHGSENADGTVELTTIDEIEPVLIEHALRMREAAAAGDADTALALLDQHRLLCAHREGPYGAGYWNRRTERALAEREHRAAGLGAWYLGRPLVVTENDYGLRLYNGDLGVVVAREDEHAGLEVAIASGGPDEGRRLGVGRLPHVRSAHAMTVHRSQGSQVRDVTVLLPEEDSPLLTRQLLYTAVTRATERVRVVGSADAVRAAVGKDVQRASGLAERLRAH